MSDDLWGLDTVTLVAGIRDGEFTARDVVTACLERIDATNPQINALTEVRPDAALEAADAADRAVAEGQPLGLLHGVPVVIKACVDVAGWVTDYGCAAMQDNMAEQSSPCVQNWLNAGAIVIGRSNTPEFACRWETTNDLYGATHNPWDAKYTPGGSSGGSAAALTVGMAALGHGTDLGGSLRHPAQACGLASIRPGRGRVPGWVPTASGEPAVGFQLMNTDGLVARRVGDARLGLQAMVAGDSHDPWWLPVPLDQSSDKPPTVALVVNPTGGGINEQVKSGVEHAGQLLNAAGYEVEEIEPPAIAEAADLWMTICLGELLALLEPAVKDICGPTLRRTFDCFRAALPMPSLEQYASAFGRRSAILRDWLAFFERYPLIVAPVSTEPPLLQDQDIASPESNREIIDSMRMTVPVNLLGLPAAVVPVLTPIDPR
jgi:amidase